MSAVVLAGLGAAILACSDFAGGFATRKNSALKIAFWVQTVGVVAAVPLFFVVTSTLRVSDSFWGVSSGIVLGFGLMMAYYCLSLGEVARVAGTVAPISIGLSILFGLLSGERPKPLTLLGMGCAILAILFVSTEIHEHESNRRVRLFSKSGCHGFKLLVSVSPQSASR